MRLTRTVATTREKPAEQARGSAIQANARQLHRIQQIAPVESQPRYSLIERDVERGIPMGSGMLMGGMTRERIEQLAQGYTSFRRVGFVSALPLDPGQ